MNSKLNELKTLKSREDGPAQGKYQWVNANILPGADSVNTVNESMERAREMVNRKTARANAMESLNEGNLDIKLKRLDMNSARERALARAEAMLSSEEGFEVKEKAETRADNKVSQ